MARQGELGLKDEGRWAFRPFMDGLPDDWTPMDGEEAIASALRSGGVEKKIAEMGVQAIAMLLGKNERYGNAALDPVRVFSQDLSAADKIRIRLDDKVSRLCRGENVNDGERPEVDMVGYLILLLIAEYEEDQDGSRKGEVRARKVQD